MKEFEKVMNLIDNIINGYMVIAHRNGLPTGVKYSGFDRDAIVKDTISQMHQAKYQADHDAIYKTLDGVKLL
jgi:hypothetical protein